MPAGRAYRYLYSDGRPSRQRRRRPRRQHLWARLPPRPRRRRRQGVLLSRLTRRLSLLGSRRAEDKDRKPRPPFTFSTGRGWSNLASTRCTYYRIVLGQSRRCSLSCCSGWLVSILCPGGVGHLTFLSGMFTLEGVRLLLHRRGR